VKPELPIIDSLLLNSDFLAEDYAQGLVIKSTQDIVTNEFLSVMSFLILNNFPREANGKKVLEWLRNLGNVAVLRSIVTQRGPTSEALLENMFRLAVEARDISVVKLLILEGVDPNGQACRHPRIPDSMTALQLACIRGNWELGIELVKAWSVIDQPGTGWQSSELVLAILGANLKRDFWDQRKFDEDYPDEKDNVDEKKDECFLKFIRYLMKKDAAVNPTVDKSSIAFSPQEDEDDETNPDLYTILHDRHSLLTIASKYRQTTLVDLFLHNQADITFLTRRGASALRECIYNSEEESKQMFGELVKYPPVSVPPLSRILGSNGLRKSEQATAVIRSLVNAGVHANNINCLCRLMHRGAHIHEQENDCYYTTFDVVIDF
jgi:hypothetical protein